MFGSFSLGSDRLNIDALVKMGSEPKPCLVIDKNVVERINETRALVETAASSKESVYGINTGFGFLSNVCIDQKDLAELQINIIRSHACGVGRMTEEKIVRSLLVLRAHCFSLGYSGVRLECVEGILGLLEHDILPQIPCKGSVGASGDLAPLAHLALALIGEGEVSYQGQVVSAKNAFERSKMKAFAPMAKEGLSLINGTQYMTAIGAHAVHQAKLLSRTADLIAAMSLDAIRGTASCFDERIQKVRPHKGQAEVAEVMRGLFQPEDELMLSHKDCDKIQDPYSFRCISQVHGATRDVLTFVENTINTELNSVTDNPLVFEGGNFISGGNFHGQPISMSLDFLAIATSELGSIAERRIEKMTNPHFSGLPAFVTKNSGINSGFMIPHVVAAALASENKLLSSPACVDSIPTSADKEDHVSMGPIAANKALKVNENVANILAIELISACQGLDLLAPLKPSKKLQNVHDKVRSVVSFAEKDRSFHQEIEKVAKMIIEGCFAEGL